MADNTKIAWADDTLNLWIGCTQLTHACDFCYARDIALRFKLVDEWNAPPKRTTANSWDRIELYQRTAKRFRLKHGRQRRVFVNSMSDIGDNQAPREWLLEACARFEAADDVVWMFVTKRPENLRKRLPAHWFRQGGWPAHVWVLVTAENAATFEHRVPLLMDLPAKVRGLSMEPLLEYVDVSWAFRPSKVDIARYLAHRLPRRRLPQFIRPLEWAIIGGESGAKARPLPPLSEVRDMIGDVRGQGGALFFKQLSQADDRKGYQDFDNFPSTIQFREHPNHVR